MADSTLKSRLKKFRILFSLQTPEWGVEALCCWVHMLASDPLCSIQPDPPLLTDLRENESSFLTNLISTAFPSFLLSRSFFPRVSAPEAGYPGALGPPNGPDAATSHRHHCCPAQRDGFSASSDQTLCHRPAHHTVSVRHQGGCMTSERRVYFC